MPRHRGHASREYSSEGRKHSVVCWPDVSRCTRRLARKMRFAHKSSGTATARFVDICERTAKPRHHLQARPTHKVARIDLTLSIDGCRVT